VEPKTGGTRAVTGDQSPGTPGLYGHGRACRVIAGRASHLFFVCHMAALRSAEKAALRGSGVSTRRRLFRRNWVECARSNNLCHLRSSPASFSTLRILLGFSRRHNPPSQLLWVSSGSTEVDGSSGEPRMNILFARVRMVAARVGSTSVLRYPRLTSYTLRAWRVSALPTGSLHGKAPDKASVLRIDGKACMTRVVVATPRPYPPSWAGTVARDGVRAQAPTATPRGSLDGSLPPRHWSA
jgi:hypothetical protein